MKKTIIKIIYVIAVFIASLMIIGRFSNHQSTDMTAEMEEATLPTVSLLENGDPIGILYGYTQEMDVTYMHGTIFPTGSEREVSFQMNLYGQTPENLRFEVRTLDGTSLVESTDITDAKTDTASDTLTASLQVKDLIEENTEYELVILGEVNGTTVRYYTRIVWTNDKDRDYLDDKLAFCTDFSKKTFDPDASSELSTYLESDSTTDNSTYAKVTINSTLSQVTWGKLDIVSHTDPQVLVVDLHEQTGSFLLQYQVVVGKEDPKTYNVEEYFRIRYTSDRIYLLDYERTMDYVFDGNTSDFSNDVINLSVSNPDSITLAESDGGSVMAFVCQDRLYSYNMTDNELAYLFGFYDAKNPTDTRSLSQNNSIQILGVDEAGNVDFSVAGYMNRGDHEGKVGIAVYSYNATTNTVEELVFIPSTQSEDIVMAYAKRLTTLGNSNQFYTIFGSDLYAVNLSDRTYESVIENMVNCDYEMPDSGEMVAWQDTSTEDGEKKISVMNLSTQAVSTVDAGDGEYIKLLGYMEDDLVYGLVKESDVHNDQMGNPVYPMYCIRIQDKDGNVLEDYEVSGTYVTDAEITDNQVLLTRVTWDADKKLYKSATDDQIMSTLEREEGSNQVTTTATDDFEMVTQISMKSEVDASAIKLLTPSQTLYEGSRDVAIENQGTNENMFFVYYKNRVVQITMNAASALNTAYEDKGIILDNTNNYIWCSGNLSTSNQIMDITNDVDGQNYSSEDSTEVCLRIILEYQGINVDVGALLDEGKTAEEILESSLPGAKILNYDSCNMDAMLYYVNQDIPVLVRLSDGSSMLMIGFNSQNIVLFNPAKGTASVYKNGMNDTEKLFEENGNHFLTYLYK